MRVLGSYSQNQQGNVSCQIFTDLPACFQYSRNLDKFIFRKVSYKKKKKKKKKKNPTH